MRPILYAYAATVTRDAARRHVVRFPDLPEALTDGATVSEALAEAADCLSEALMSRIVDGEGIPSPSAPRRGHYQIAPDPTVALKAALYSAAREQGVSAAELARRLRLDRREARRLLDPEHPTKLPRLADALDALGLRVTVAVYDASRRHRLVSAPTAPKPRTKTSKRKRPIRVDHTKFGHG